jgi:hypothetical protein
MLRIDRPTAQAIAKRAGWSPEWLRWAGLADEAPAPILKKKASK